MKALALALLAFPPSAAAEEYARVAAALARACAGASPCRVAVLPFPRLGGRLGPEAWAVQERLSALLSEAPGLRVASAEKVRAALEATGLSALGLLEPPEAAKLGRELGADLLISGSATELDARRDLLVGRAVRRSDGSVAAAAQGWVRRAPKAEADSAQAPRDGPPDEAGEALYRRRCSACHGELGLGRGRLEAVFGRAELDLSDPASAGLSNRALRRQVAEGGGRMPPHGGLPGFAERLDDAELAAVVGYLRSLRPQEAPSADGDAELSAGRRAYERRCTHCHGPEGKGSPEVSRLFGLKRKDLDLGRKDVELLDVQGLKALAARGSGKMPPNTPALSDEDAAALLRWLHCLAP